MVRLARRMAASGSRWSKNSEAPVSIVEMAAIWSGGELEVEDVHVLGHPVLAD
jgi:hypothetical protein